MISDETPGKLVLAFKSLVNTVSGRPRASIAVVLTLILCGWLLLLGVSNYNQDRAMYAALVQHIKDASDINPNPVDMQKIIENKSISDTAINRVLETLLKAGADRAYVMRFHNGSRDTNGTHFLYLSTTNEVTKPGIENAMPFMQDIQTSMLEPKWLSSFIAGKCVETSIETTQAGSVTMGLMTKVGIKQMHICPILNIDDGRLMGVAGVSWVVNKPVKEVDTKVDNALFGTVLPLSSLLTPI